jgi:hypothetical protein
MKLIVFICKYFYSFKKACVNGTCFFAVLLEFHLDVFFGAGGVAGVVFELYFDLNC